MTSLADISDSDFDVVAAMDNALPHLSADQLAQAARAVHARLRPGGLLIASVRDYDRLIVEKPTIQPPAFYSNSRGRWFVHQVWDWEGDRYTLHLYITAHFDGIWSSHHFVGQYRCLLRTELTATLEAAGFEHVRWLTPEESGYYQPIVLAAKHSP